MSNHRFGPRTNARSQALQLLFQAEINNRTVDDVLSSDYVLSDGPLDEFGEQLARGVGQQRLTLDAIIAQTSNNWTIDRMPVVDRNLLRLALYEMLFVDEVATPISIDEYVELSKAYGATQTRKFVNGLLGRVARRIEGGVDVIEQAKQYAEEHPGFDDFGVYEPAEPPAQKREYEPYKGQLDEPDEDELEAEGYGERGFGERGGYGERRGGYDRDDYDRGRNYDDYEPYDGYDDERGYGRRTGSADERHGDNAEHTAPRMAQGSGDFAYDDADGAEDGYGTIGSAASVEDYSSFDARTDATAGSAEAASKAAAASADDGYGSADPADDGYGPIDTSDDDYQPFFSRRDGE